MLLADDADDTAVQRRARELALGYLDNSSSVPPTMAGAVLRAAASGGDRALYDRYVAQLPKMRSTPEEYYRFLNALAWFRDPALVTRTLELANSTEVRSQDAPTLIGLLLAQPGSQDQAWAFVKAHWKELSDRLGVFQGIPGIVASLGGFCSAERATDMRAFFAEHPEPPAARSLQQSIERIDSCVALDTRQSAPFTRWLNAQR
jgi:aminopeptidase N